MRIPLDDRSRVLVLTGAGISAESGVPTFRDANGLWEGHDVTRVASPEGFEDDPTLVWRFYAGRRAAMAGVRPNAGHAALVALEARLGDRFLLATQNVDGLHRDAGSTRMVEMHGNLMTTRCATCDRAPFRDTTAHATVPVCTSCHGGLLRPDIVWFGESLDPAVLDRLEQFVTTAGRDLVFVAVGTSGVVYPAAGLVEVTRRVGGTSYLVNLEPPANVASFDHVVLGPSATQLPTLFA
ncbi:MAG: NAD-dependent deacylase [Proteobacteria bacterium]|nr:NAD-dependent deacylase [Pseudomonadota bacterium]